MTEMWRCCSVPQVRETVDLVEDWELLLCTKIILTLAYDIQTSLSELYVSKNLAKPKLGLSHQFTQFGFNVIYITLKGKVGLRLHLLNLWML